MATGRRRSPEPDGGGDGAHTRRVAPWTTELMPFVLEKWGTAEPWLRPCGSVRALIFRAAAARSGPGRSVERRAAGLVDMLYDGQAAMAAEDMENHVLDSHGVGLYRLVVQEADESGSWRYARSCQVDITAEALAGRRMPVASA